MESETDIYAEGGELVAGAEAAISPAEILATIGRSLRRHVRLSIGVAIGVAALGICVAIWLPSQYMTVSRIMYAQSAAVTSALSSPDQRGLPTVEAFAGSAELLKQKATLRTIVKETNLLARWHATRPLPLRWKDKLVAAVGAAPSVENQITALVEMLDTRMYITQEKQVLGINVMWNDPDAAQKIASVAQERFFDTKRNQELGAISTAISLNEDEVKRSEEAIERSLQEVLKVRDRLKQEALVRSSAVPSTGNGGAARLASARTVRSLDSSHPITAIAAPPDKKLTTLLSELRQKAREVEAPWQRRLAELKYQREDLRATYGPEHPVVLQHEAKIREATNPPEELGALREQEHQVLAQIETASRAAEEPEGSSGAKPSGRGALASVAQALPATARERLASGDGTLVIAEREDDPTIAPVKANLDAAIQAYGDATRRLENARLQLTSSQVAFQYRYVVVTEPERPRKPLKPNRVLLVVGALLGAVVAGILAAAARDLLSGRVYEPWQIRTLGVAIIGEVGSNASLKR